MHLYDVIEFTNGEYDGDADNIQSAYVSSDEMLYIPDWPYPEYSGYIRDSAFTSQKHKDEHGNFIKLEIGEKDIEKCNTDR